MVLDSQRDKVGPFLTALAKPFMGVSPNALSVISLACAIAAALLLIIWRDPFSLVAAMALILLNGLFDAVDGVVARLTGKSSRRGDLVDHVFDRYSDFIILGGIAFSPFADVHLGLVAVGSVMIASYMGTQSQALGLKRDYGGMLGRAERMVLLMVFLVLQFLAIEFGFLAFDLLGFSFWLLDVMFAVFIVAANVTAIQRFVRMWRALE